MPPAWEALSAIIDVTPTGPRHSYRYSSSTSLSSVASATIQISETCPWATDPSDSVELEPSGIQGGDENPKCFGGNLNYCVGPASTYGREPLPFINFIGQCSQILCGRGWK